MYLKCMIFLDLDGVCCDYVIQVLNYHLKTEREYLKLLQDNPDDHPYKVLEDLIGVKDQNAYWDEVERYGVKYWSEMPVFDWFDHLYDELKKVSEVKFLTSAPMMTTAHHGKAEWVKQNAGKDALYDLIICPSPMKKFLAQPGRVLIDDTKSNIIGWRENNGHAFHFPSLQFFHRHPEDLDIIQAIEFAREHSK